MRTRSSMPFFFVSSLALGAAAQATAPEPAAGAPASQSTAPQSTPPRATEAAAPVRAEGTLELGVSATPPASDPYAIDTNSELDSGSSEAAVAPSERTGFEAGLRLGATLPVGKAGRNVFGVDRDLKDLTAWRAPVWIDVGYHFSDVMTFGAYAQVGVGGNGDACEQIQSSVAELGELRGGDCDWSDIRLGAHAQWRLAPAAAVDPWLGVGLGYEWLSYRTVLVADVTNTTTGNTQAVALRIAERLGGPELLLQGGIDFQVDDSLRIGPYASATFGQYLGDEYDCDIQTAACPTGSSVEGPAFHSWLGVGLRGAYAP